MKTRLELNLQIFEIKKQSCKDLHAWCLERYRCNKCIQYNIQSFIINYVKDNGTCDYRNIAKSLEVKWYNFKLHRDLKTAFKNLMHNGILEKVSWYNREFYQFIF